MLRSPAEPRADGLHGLRLTSGFRGAVSAATTVGFDEIEQSLDGEERIAIACTLNEPHHARRRRALDHCLDQAGQTAFGERSEIEPPEQTLAPHPFHQGRQGLAE